MDQSSTAPSGLSLDLRGQAAQMDEVWLGGLFALQEGPVNPLLTGANPELRGGALKDGHAMPLVV
ncbi:hypothetical protein ACFLT5_00480 [Chloroflexota bacterium]